MIEPTANKKAGGLVMTAAVFAPHDPKYAS